MSDNHETSKEMTVTVWQDEERRKDFRCKEPPALHVTGSLIVIHSEGMDILAPSLWQRCAVREIS